MGVYYKYKSGKEIFVLPLTDSIISVSQLKRHIMESQRYGHGRTRGRRLREDIAISNAQTGEEYVDESTTIPNNSTVIIRRVVGHLTDSIVTYSTQKVIEDGSLAPNKSVVTESTSKSSDVTEVADEEAAIEAVVAAAELKWEDPSSETRHAGARFTAGRRCGRATLEGVTPPPGYVCRSCQVPGHFIQHCPLENKTPPPGYVCHRCQVPGHFIHHCPTNSDPKFEFKRMARSVVPVVSTSFVDGIPSELVPAASASVVDDLPAELHCQLCKKVMTDVVLTSKCCFDSFCDKCIRAYIIAQSKCICGAKTLADDLIPNQTLRSAITNMLATRASSTSSSAGKARSSAGSNLDPICWSHNPSAALKEETMECTNNLSSVTPEDGLLVTTENKQVELCQVDLKSKTNNNSVGLSAEKSAASGDALEAVSEPKYASQSTSKNTTVSRVLESKATSAERSKRKRKKTDSAETGHPNNAYGYPFHPAYYDPFFGGLPCMYGTPGMPYGGYPMSLYDVNAINNVSLNAFAMQGDPSSHYSWESQPQVHHDAKAAAHTRQTETLRDGSLRSRSSGRNCYFDCPPRAESRSKTRLDSKRQDHCNTSNDYNEEHRGVKKMRASSPRDYDRRSNGRSSRASSSLAYEDFSDEERNFKRRWRCQSSVAIDTRP